MAVRLRGDTLCQRLRVHPGQRLPAAGISVRRAPGNRQRRSEPPPHRHRRRRAGRPDPGLFAGTLRCAGRAAGRGQHRGRQGRLVARHLLHPEVAGNLRAPGHLRPHRGQGHPVERGPHLRRPGRGLFVRPAPAKRLQPLQPAALHQHPAVLHRGLPGRAHPRARPCRPALAQPGDGVRAEQRMRHPHHRHARGRVPDARRPRDRRQRRAQPVPGLGRRVGHRQERRRPLVHRRRALQQAPAGGASHLDRGALSTKAVPSGST